MFIAGAALAEEAAAAAAPVPTLDSGSTAWMLTSTVLVLMMTIPGLALFYGGMVRKKNILATMMQSFAITALVSVLWVLVGYSLAFAEGTPYVGGLGKVLLAGVEVGSLTGVIPETVFIVFQMTFAIITPALITGAFADRMKFSAMLVFMGLWVLVVYAPICHWVWGGGFLGSDGVLDYAGGTVVHINAGVAGLVAAIVLGPRKGFGTDNMAPANLSLAIIGASLLWVGWFGFNAGSAAAADGRAGMAMLVTQVAAAAAALAWMAAEWMLRGKPSVLGAVSGAVAGLVAITPASGFVGVGGALIIGIAAGVICFWGATGLKHALKYDDSLDAFGVHGIGGIVGAVLTGVFAVESIGGTAGLLEGNGGQVLTQLYGIVATIVWSAVASFILLKLIDLVIGLRVTPDEEREGLDLSLHGESIH
ncbi:ammonium transporter [Magnetospirillum sulfuroxidans]|uniref:Ammonium transporter n=1 Tax=Magnetospirillum sulfuroxidans TaxID=611300 RepID=A0ABS5IHV0_9PROT|nr:ammonium transporter [Magnetospirillum sulfuroxidans]MBR9973924.1 ammonium transporter [Magnetospirillum sulfuroxidans]